MGPFDPIAFGAGETQIVCIVQTTVLFRDRVLDVEADEIGVFFMKAKIFATAGSPVPDESPQGGIHHPPGDAARSCRALDLRMPTNVP